MRKQLFLIALFLNIISGYGQVCNCTNAMGCNITASIPYNDTAKGDYTIFYGNSSNTLINPFIIVEGLDLNNNFSCQDFYNSGIPTALNGYGYDVVFLNLHNNLDYVQSNAFLIVKLINEINSLKVGNNELIVAGINTGAIEARYALSYMETNGMNHSTKCFLSIDGAQRGVNIPLTLQVWLDQVAYDGLSFGNVDAISESLLLQQPIFQQLLYCDHDKSISKGFPCPGDSYISFFNELRTLTPCYGYPAKCKKIAISNGAINGTSQLNVDGTRAYSTSLFFSYSTITSSILSTYSGYVHATYDTSVRPIILAGNTPVDVAVSDYTSYLLWGLTGVDSFRPYDVCPGSYSEFVYDAANGVQAYGDTTAIGFVNATFIPTISAFDINTDNFYFDFQSNWPIEGTISPFDKCYALGSYFYGGNGDANYIDYADLFSSTDILAQIENSNSYTECEGTDYAIPPTIIDAGASQNWRVSQYLTASDLIVDSGGAANLIAGEAVIISPGTVFNNGSTVTIEIKPCTYNVCTPPVEKVGRIPVSINESMPSKQHSSITTSNELEVYPNPANSVLNIKLPTIPTDNSKVLVYNDEGMLVRQLDIRQRELQISVLDLPDGIYSLIFKSNTAYASKQFTVAKY